MHRRTVFSLVAVLATSPLAAQVTGPVYPPPGGVTFSSSGTSASRASGRTNFYSGMSPAAYDDLYWTFFKVDNPWVMGPGGFGPTGQMNQIGGSLGSGHAWWYSSAPTQFVDAFGVTRSTTVYFNMQVQQYSGVHHGGYVSSFIPLTTAGVAGIGSLPPTYPVLDVASLTTSDDRFQVWYSFSTLDGRPLLDWYESFTTQSGAVLQTSASGGFYASPPGVVPEPATVALMATGLLMIGGVAARRRKALKQA